MCRDFRFQRAVLSLGVRRRALGFVAVVLTGLALPAAVWSQCDNPPVATDVAATSCNRSNVFDVLRGAYEPNGEAMTVSNLSASGTGCTAGSATVLYDMVRLAPTAGWDSCAAGNTCCTVSFRVTDERGGFDTATLTVKAVEATACLPSGFFSDDFESGDTSAWAETCPGAGCES